jgi:hypothetical protein
MNRAQKYIFSCLISTTTFSSFTAHSLPSSGTFVISYFATYSSVSDFLGFTFLLYRTFHHSLHWGPHWRNTARIFLAPRNPILGKVKFLVRICLRLKDYIYVAYLLSISSAFQFYSQWLHMYNSCISSFHVESFSFCPKHIL